MKLVSSFSTPLALAITLLLLLAAHLCETISESIIGSRETCESEGENFTVAKIPNSRCFNCICKNGFVECQKQDCPRIEGCYTLLDLHDDDCCFKCKGCVRRGIHHMSGTEWIESEDPCRVLSCEAGIITESKLRCYTPCRKPIPPAPGQCCSTCPGCSVNGQNVTAERAVTTTEDPCVTCKCNENRVTCAKHACPVLHCLASKIIQEPGECCPRCTGSGKFFPPPKGACLLGTTLHNTDSQFYIDDCTRCTCTNSVITCYKESCPVLECPKEYQIRLPGRCCPLCPAIEEGSFCTFNGMTYKDGETWKLNPCKACACVQGKIRCALNVCQPEITCPLNTRLEHPEGQCCPRCVEVDGVCTIFGDSHYRSFDGKFFNFKGACKYQLTNDCVNHSFSIRVTNDIRSARSSSWTKSITLKVGNDVKINLGQRMRVKVNGEKVDLPFSLPGKLNINKTMDSIMVSTQIGVKLLWNGNSFLEVSAPTKYRGSLRGLCGNYNARIKDDFTTRRKRLVQDAHTFGQSWAVGTKRMCWRSYNMEREKRCRGRKDHRLCNRLKSQIFSTCNRKVNPAIYYKSCLQDMCDCPTGYCYCESIMAYVSECQRAGLSLLDWRNSTKCFSTWDHAGPISFRRHLL